MKLLATKRAVCKWFFCLLFCQHVSSFHLPGCPEAASPLFVRKWLNENAKFNFDMFMTNNDRLEDPCLTADAPSRREFLALSTALAASFSTPFSADATQIMSETSSVSRGSSSKITSYNPEIPFSSVRRYKNIKLSNGLRVLLVSDRRAYRASAAVTVQGAGQFAEPSRLPGLAHLMEHMILSYNSKSTFRQSRDFEDWLGDKEGASNAFTAYQMVCFYFSCPDSVLAEALQRFAGLFLQQDVEKVCRDEATIKREIRRVDSELALDDVSEQAFYLTKQFVNLEHPFSRFTRGSVDTLGRIPKETGINVGNRLIRFFHEHYLPEESILVVIGPQDLLALERMVAPFGTAFSRYRIPEEILKSRRHCPGAFLEGSRNKQVVLYRKSGDVSGEKLSFQWSFDLDYRGKKPVASQVAFCVAQVMGRRGPGSLYEFLQRRGWVPKGSGLPRVSLPVDVSGLQVLKLEINLTSDGFLRRSSVVSAVYDSLETLRRGNSLTLSRELVAQYTQVAKLHGYLLAPRPPDSIELAVDAQLYGIGGAGGVGTGNWYRFSEDRNEISSLQRAVSWTLTTMSDSTSALILVTAGTESISRSEASSREIDVLPPITSSKWQTEPVSGALFLYQDILRPASRVEQAILRRTIARDELLPPLANPLVPFKLRPPRIIREIDGMTNINELVVCRTVSESTDTDRVLRMTSNTKRTEKWSILEPYPGQYGLLLPRGPPEPSCRAAFVLELLSPRPARADIRQAAQAELWRLSFEKTALDLAEVGAPGGLAYDVSFNKFGLRIAVIGLSQTIPSYTRRLVRRLVEHHEKLLRGPKYFPSSLTASAVSTASRTASLGSNRRRLIVSNLRRASAYEAAAEGIAFFLSCTGGVCFAQGDLLYPEVMDLLEDLKAIIEPSLGQSRVSKAATPEITDLLYKSNWKPSGCCSMAGVSLVSDACGRLPR